MPERRSIPLVIFASLVAMLSMAAGMVLASHHPVAPVWVTAAFIAWTTLALRRPRLWLFAVPAALPLLDFLPWTGWLVFDELDLMILGTLAAGFAHLAREKPSLETTPRPSAPASASPLWILLAASLGAIGLIAFFRGIADAGGWSFGWFDGYTDPLNSWRILKGMLYALLLLPLLQRELARSKAAALQRFSRGMLCGVAIVALAVVWERVAYPGLIDFSAPYRTTALFWEMHVGGAALDVYLAMASPFVAWALWSARSWAQWITAAVIALLTGYAVLTTFSRGVYVGVAGPLLLLALWLWAPRWRRVLQGRGPRVIAAALLSLGLLGEAVGVFAGGSFMFERLAAGDRDLAKRLVHWKRGVQLLQGPSDWLFGIGLGRLPTHYANASRAGEFSGELHFSVEAPDTPVVTLSGPRFSRRLGGAFGLTQRVALRPGSPHHVHLLLRTQKSVQLLVSVCEIHLLYPRQCQESLIRVLASSGSWQDVELSTAGPALSRGDWFAPRLGAFEVAVATPGGSVDINRIRLTAPDGEELLQNGDFSGALAHWFPLAQEYYLPWHIDNQWLELLIERGLTGVAVFLAIIGCALWRLYSSRQADLPIAPFLAASLVGAQLVGLVSSVMDTPRVAFLLFFLCFMALQSTRPAVASEAPPGKAPA